MITWNVAQEVAQLGKMGNSCPRCGALETFAGYEKHANMAVLFAGCHICKFQTQKMVHIK